MTTLPEEAVKAAIRAWFEDTRPETVNASPLPEQARRMRLALTAAIPFMIDAPCGYRLIPQQPTQTVLEIMAFNLSAEFGADFTRENQEFALAVYNEAWTHGIRPLEPSAAREPALDALKTAYASMEGSCSANHRIAMNTVDAAIRALSSPDHADAGKVDGDKWRPIESAPKDGSVIHVWAEGFEWPETVKWVDFEDAELKAEVGADGYWTFADEFLADAVDSVEPEIWTHWRPLPPAPASEGGE